MAKYTIEDTTLANIAEAIREKSGTTDTLTPVQMPDAITAIEAGGGDGEPSRRTGIYGTSSSACPQLLSTYSDTSAKVSYMYYGNLGTSTSSVSNYVWFKKTKNDVWPVFYVKATSMTEAKPYKLMFYIWCSEGKTVEWSNNNVYFNENCQTTHNLTTITDKPQLFEWEFTYTKSSSSYEPTLHIYPAFANADADTNLYVTPVLLFRTDMGTSYYSTHLSAY